MKTITILQLASFLCIPVFAQVNFQRIYGGVGNERGHTVIQTMDKGYAIGGYTNSFGAGGDDIFILKVDSFGTIQWQKTYGNLRDEGGLPVVIKESPDSSLIVTGFIDGDGSRISDLYLFKTDYEGNLVWGNKYDSGPQINSGDHGRALLFTKEGDILVFGTDDANTFGANDGLLMKVNRDGSLIWKKVFGGVSNDHLHGAIELPGGNLLICGSSQSFGPGNTAGLLLKTNPHGDIIWSKTYGGDALEGFNACDTSNNFSIVVTGLTDSYGAGQTDVLLSKIDSSGNLLWSRTYGGHFNERGAAVKTTADGGFLLTAFTDSYGNGDRDILIIRTDANGEPIWSRTFGTSAYESVNDWANSTLAVLSNQTLIITGWSDSLSVGGEDVILIKSNVDGSAFCQDVLLQSDSPVMSEFTFDMETASPGVYHAASTLVLPSAMISRSICYCTDDCHICEHSVVHYTFNDCYSNTIDGSDMDYSEFVPEYVNSIFSAELYTSTIYRNNPASQKHSCTPGLKQSPAICVSSLNSCKYSAGNESSVLFELTILPHADSAIHVSGLKFFQKAPTVYDWINGPSGLNNYPKRFGLRILKNEMEIYRREDIPTSVDEWHEENFKFLQDASFIADDSCTFRFELLSYCLIGNNSLVTAWDLEDIEVFVQCDPITGNKQHISGFVRTATGEALSDVTISLSDIPGLTDFIFTTTDSLGHYDLWDVPGSGKRHVHAYDNSDPISGITTRDLITIQKHLLGTAPLEKPFQLIAADVNRSNSISVLDIITLRKLLLHQISSFPNNTSWRFAVADQELDAAHPWNFIEGHELSNLNVDIGNAHFVGIKIGDVIDDVRSHVLKRQESGIQFIMYDQPLTPMQQTRIEVLSSDFTNIMGFQGVFILNHLNLQSIQSGKIEIVETNFNFTETGLLYICWHHADPVTIDDDDVLFTLVVLPHTPGDLSGMVSFDTSLLDPEGYQGLDLEIVPLDFRIMQSPSVDSVNIFWNSPNPMYSSTQIHFVLASPGETEFYFYNVSGELLTTIKRCYDQGEHEITISKQDLKNQEGIILCKMITDGQCHFHKILLID